jgi:hypothetical protein
MFVKRKIMKKVTYYNQDDTEIELSFFINQESEISFFIDNSSQPASSISLNIDDVEDMINQLQLLILTKRFKK